MTDATVGAAYTYTADVGLGRMHADRDLHPDHASLDLQPGTEVTVAGHDEERGLVLVEWADTSGNPRITSVDPDLFGRHFEQAGD